MSKPVTKSLMNRLMEEIKEELKQPEVKIPNATEHKIKIFFKQTQIMEDSGTNYANLYELSEAQLRALKKSYWELKKIAFLIRRDRQKCRDMLVEAKEKLLELGHSQEAEAIKVPEYPGVNVEMRPFKRRISSVVNLNEESESDSDAESEK